MPVGSEDSSSATVCVDLIGRALAALSLAMRRTHCRSCCCREPALCRTRDVTSFLPSLSKVTHPTLLLLLLLLLDASELALLRAILILRRTAPIAVTVGLCSPARNPCV